jgi:hypothetical protein
MMRIFITSSLEEQYRTKTPGGTLVVKLDNWIERLFMRPPTTLLALWASEA